MDKCGGCQHEMATDNEAQRQGREARGNEHHLATRGAINRDSTLLFVLLLLKNIMKHVLGVP